MTKYSPEELKNDPHFELLREIDHHRIKAFILEQVHQPGRLMRWYGVYQVVMMLLYLLLFGMSVVPACHGNWKPLMWMGAALLFALSLLIVLHELLHALAYWHSGVRKLKAGALWRKFIFYVAADRQVVDYPVFRRVAWAPFVGVKLLTLVPGLLLWGYPSAYFFFSLMCIHSLFCAGDVAMLSFYERHSGLVIYNFDDLSEGKTFFYVLKNEA
ncbi:DUF3267 domain-containing protein [Mangrovibacterium marinum]|uniref:Putative zincin peptidase n=1 Tax=Mangrovibacterium marinum TaxID=1639118 RepID=A0A2T5C677_9BACT|nr:DUF3267 domain-containing protein [Mangrovibacterium marinum]PTN10426.1 putative zincin peptidase [Mangrovibacterium marinum]